MSAIFPKSLAAATSKSEETEEDKRSEPLAAAQRLAESRERLRQYMLRGNGRHDARRRAAAAQAQGVPVATLDRLRSLPVLGVIIDAAAAWWSNHPLQPAATVAEQVARDAVAPFTRRHPISVLIGAFFIGGAIAWFRPWRLLGKSAVFGGLVSQLASHALIHVPWESLLGAITSFADSKVDSTREAPAEKENVSSKPEARIYKFDEAA